MLKKGTEIKKFGNKQFYYAGRTLYPSKARLTVLELADRGIRSRVIESKSMGNLIWTDKRTYVDLSEPITGRYRNPTLIKMHPNPISKPLVLEIRVSGKEPYIFVYGLTKSSERYKSKGFKLEHNAYDYAMKLSKYYGVPIKKV